MESKPRWSLLYGPLFVIAAVIVGSFALGLRDAWEQRLVAGALTLVVVLTMAWLRGNRRALLLEGAARSGVRILRIHEPAPIRWPVPTARGLNVAISEQEDRSWYQGTPPTEP